MRVRFRCDPALRDLLPPPRPAREALPDWLRKMPAMAFSSSHRQDLRTLKHCPPFIDAMTHGFVMSLPCDVTASAGELRWDWRLPPLTVEGHTRSPMSFSCSPTDAGHAIFRWAGHGRQIQQLLDRRTAEGMVVDGDPPDQSL